MSAVGHSVSRNQSALMFAMRLALLGFLFLLTYDGALRKWIVPGVEQVIFILKDALIVAALGYVAANGGHRFVRGAVPAQVRGTFALYALWVVHEALNPRLPHILVGVWGVKAHLLYAALILLVPIAFADLKSAFRTLEKVFPFLVVPVCALAMYQITLPPGHFLNQQVRGDMEGMAFFGEANLVRVAGTFSYISGMGAFVQSCVLLGVGLYLAGARSLLFLGGLAFALAALPVTGSRAVIVTVSGGAALMLFAGVAAKTTSVLLVLRAFALIAGLLAFSFLFQDVAWEALQQRADLNREEGLPRVFTAFTNAFVYFNVSGAFGYGSGSANLGAVSLAPGQIPFSWLPVGMNFEEESGRIVLELGIIGWALSLLMRVALMLWAMRLIFGGETREARAAAVMAIPFLALGVHTGNGVFTASYMGTAYWFVVALVAMAEYEHQRARAARQMARQAQRFRPMAAAVPRNG